MAYMVYGIAHGDYFVETGFPTQDAAVDYASIVADGDVDSTVQVVRQTERMVEVASFDAQCFEYYGSEYESDDLGVEYYGTQE